MSVALPIDARDPSWPDTLGNGVVAVHHYGFTHFSAMCSCGWTGRRRYFRASAQLDAWEHAMHEKCDVSVPLVIPAAS
jgi:hypothetical protein